jgi:hypothetical protein
LGPLIREAGGLARRWKMISFYEIPLRVARCLKSAPKDAETIL